MPSTVGVNFIQSADNGAPLFLFFDQWGRKIRT